MPPVRRDVAADGAGAARGEIDRIDQAVHPRGLVHRVQRDAGLDGQRAVDRVEAEHAVHAFEADHEFAVRRDRAAGKPGATAGRHQRDTLGVGPAHDRLHSSIDAGSAIASGAGVQRRVQSRP
jgi:hypothetical protein